MVLVLDTHVEVEKYIPIPLDGICGDSILDFNLYMEVASGKTNKENYVLYREQNVPIGDWHLQRLINSGVDRLYIQESDQKNYSLYLEKNLDRILADKKIDLAHKAHIAYEAALGLVQDVFKNPTDPKSMERSIHLVNNTIAFTSAGKDAVLQFVALMGRDYNTYTHSVNVCLYSIALAKQAKIGDEGLAGVGLGGLLHDIGKSNIDDKIIKKPGPLNSDEWTIMKRHPGYGANILKNFPKLPEVAYKVVYEHHEKCNGSGYPNGLAGDHINPYAKIMCLADVFDALTTNRPYKKSIDSFNALKIMRDEMRGAFDIDLWAQFTKMLGKEA